MFESGEATEADHLGHEAEIYIVYRSNPRGLRRLCAVWETAAIPLCTTCEQVKL